MGGFRTLPKGGGGVCEEALRRNAEGGRQLRGGVVGKLTPRGGTGARRELLLCTGFDGQCAFWPKGQNSRERPKSSAGGLTQNNFFSFRFASLTKTKRRRAEAASATGKRLWEGGNNLATGDRWINRDDRSVGRRTSQKAQIDPRDSGNRVGSGVSKVFSCRAEGGGQNQ